ncbi:MAG TPA: hypothetical protein DGG94_13040 [Micromonosporaceae bacterium]|nr:hypothetical protein [Micromonosporaceae bacterium]HCU50706.1 hypothetical protein [Micromonosporaceae bacterium]
MDDPIAEIARATAQRLTTRHGYQLSTELEVALRTRQTTPANDRYGDPVAIASLIIAIATLTWTIYSDLKKATPSPPPETIARTTRIRLRETHNVDTMTSNSIIDIAVEETIRHHQ